MFVRGVATDEPKRGDWAAVSDQEPGEGGYLPVRGDPELTPQQKELAEKRLELLEIHEQVIEREMKLQTLEAAVDAFHRERLLSLGALNTEIDDLKAKIAERELAEDPESPILQRRVQEATARAEQTREEVHEAQEAGPPERVTLSEEHKETYRAAARAMHPDLCQDEHEREVRTEYMQRLNEAYVSGDTERIHELAAAWEAEVEPQESEDLASDLARVAEVIARRQQTLQRVEAEIDAVRSSPNYKLMMQVRRARERGSDPLEELAEKLRIRRDRLLEKLGDLDAGPEQ